MCDLMEEQQPQPAVPVKRQKLLPYLILAGLFAIGLIIYLLIPIQPQ